VGGNPLTRVDPNGKNPVVIGVGIGVIGGGVVFAITPGSFSDRLAATVDFEIAYASAVTLAAVLPERLAVQLAAIVLGTSIDAGLYGKSVGDIINPKSQPQTCPAGK
jgi:hypothetical protein